MKEERYFYVPDAANQQELPTDEAMHAMRVLRLKGGDDMFLMDGVGNYYHARVTIAATHHCYYEILEKLPQEPQWQGHIHLAIAPTKMMDRIEFDKKLKKAIEDARNSLKSAQKALSGMAATLSGAVKQPVDLSSLIICKSVLSGNGLSTFIRSSPRFFRTCRDHTATTCL